MTGRIAKATLCGLLMMSVQVHASDRVRAPYVPDNGSLALRCGVLIDGISDLARMDHIVVLHEGRITRVNPSSARPAAINDCISARRKSHARPAAVRCPKRPVSL